MGDHLVLVNGVLDFQSDKYPQTPHGKVPLSTKDVTAQDLLWEYAQRRRAVDAEFASDLEQALKNRGFKPPPKARSYTFKCTHCPTSIRVMTEAPHESEADAQLDKDGVLEMHPYEATNFVGGNSRDGDYVTADLCPACGSPLKLEKRDE